MTSPLGRRREVTMLIRIASTRDAGVVDVVDAGMRSRFCAAKLSVGVGG